MNKDIIKIAEETDITLDGYPADFYEYGEDNMIIVENHFSETENHLLEPKVLVVSNENFKRTILKRKGKF